MSEIIDQTDPQEDRYICSECNIEINFTNWSDTKEVIARENDILCPICTYEMEEVLTRGKLMDIKKEKVSFPDYRLVEDD